ncbi:outer membrane beta-barrel protein [Paraferrimonas haliotis]|uniref:Beta-barrel porin 2 n=1 Tax=Paraferrimonas haliotis TaxID=2013866 RepID=A0AA37TUS1_9GAMM|nr:outer membrane beta-barrel protein [Paraferrimonas haliotis]GLS84601.1 hypothetical protein GCM10007894_25780 [Paraferrimonas haliotis]
MQGFPVKAFAALTTAILMSLSSARADVQPQPYVFENGLELNPYVKASLFNDNNVIRSQTDTISSFGSHIEPGVELVGNPGNSQFEVGYRLVQGNYYDSNDDNFTDHFLNGVFNWNLATRHRLNFYYNFDKMHEGRGYGFSEGRGELFDEVVKIDRQTGEVVYSFGGENATGRIDVGFRHRDKRYTNFRDATQFQDLTETRYLATFFYRIAAKTSLLIEGVKVDNRYKVTRDQTFSRDNDDYFAFVGAEMSSDSAKLTGKVRLGYQNKRFKEGRDDSFHDFSWDVNIGYLLKAYSKLTLETSQRAKNPSQETGDYVKASLIRLNWKHFWLDRFATIAEYHYGKDAYSGIVRDDTIKEYTVGLEYDVQRWMNVGLSYTDTNKSSNAAGIGFDQSIIAVTFHVTL